MFRRKRVYNKYTSPDGEQTVIEYDDFSFEVIDTPVSYSCNTFIPDIWAKEIERALEFEAYLRSLTP